MKIGVISLGCCKNLVDTENLLGMLEFSNVSIVSKPSQADAIIINTCGFIEMAKTEAIDTILEMADYKNKKCKKLIVMGCLAQRYQQTLIEELPEVDRFIRIDEYSMLDTILSEVLEIKITGKYNCVPRKLSGKPWMAYLKIADGCDNRCAFCAIPLIRGPYRSFKMEELLSEAKRLVSIGVKEINLIAQDTTRYGLDLERKRLLIPLLQQLNAIEEVRWIRLLYMYPDEIDEELIKAMSSLDKVLPYFDIPVQHGSNRMLKVMNRRGTIEEILDVIDIIKKYYPNPILRSTLIVGFPSETEEDFNQLLTMVNHVKWDHLGAFTYSREEDTSSYLMEDDVTEDVKNERLQRVLSLQNQIREEKMKQFINQEFDVIVESQNGLTGMYQGRSFYHAPDGIDGGVYFKSESLLSLGDIVSVSIEKVVQEKMFGKIIKK